MSPLEYIGSIFNFGVVSSLILIILIILITRELWTWYWKINKITHLLEEIKEEIKNKSKI